MGNGGKKIWWNDVKEGQKKKGIIRKSKTCDVNKGPGNEEMNWKKRR